MADHYFEQEVVVELVEEPKLEPVEVVVAVATAVERLELPTVVVEDNLAAEHYD